MLYLVGGWLHMEWYMFYLVEEGYTWSSTCCISLERVTHGVVHVVSRWDDYTWGRTCRIL